MESIINETVRALWFNNPYAHLMLNGKIETRNRPTNVRGLVLICSCKKEYASEKVLSISGERQVDRIDSALADLGQWWNGYAIAIGELVECRPMTIEDEDACFVKYKAGLWCWIFKNVKSVKYFEIKGVQGWKILSEEDKNKIQLLQNT